MTDQVMALEILSRNLTDQERELLIELLQNKIVVSKVTREILESLKEEQEHQEGGLRFSSPKVIEYFFYDHDWHPDYYEQYGTSAIENINWQWIYEELQHAQKNDK